MVRLLACDAARLVGLAKDALPNALTRGTKLGWQAAFTLNPAIVGFDSFAAKLCCSFAEFGMDSSHLVRSVAARDVAAFASKALVYLGILAAFAVVTFIGCAIWLLVW